MSLRSIYRYLVYPSILLVRGEISLFERLKQLRQQQWWSEEELRKYQTYKLSKLLNHAVRRSSFYRETLGVGSVDRDGDVWGYLASLPLLSKSDLQRSGDEVAATGWVGRVSQKTSGGSTGEPVTIKKDRKAIAQERAAMWLGYSWSDIEIGDKAARFWGSHYNTRQRLLSRAADWGMRRVRFSAFAFQDADMQRFWDTCRQQRPDYFHGYVSMLDEFAVFVSNRGFDGREIDLKAIVATSEVLTDPQRKRIEDTFGARVQVEYGCGEVGPIAYECEEGSLHLMAANLVIEFLNANGQPVQHGETGEIVITDLHNRAMPLLRYRVGDHGIPGTRCDCGRVFPVLTKIWGREYDVIVTPDGRRFHGEYFMYVFQQLAEEGEKISQFQVLQTATRRIELRMVAAGQLDSQRIGEKVRGLVDPSFREMEFAVRLVDRIERAPSGKMQVIRNDWLRAREEPV